MKKSVIDPNLLKILACPESHQPLRLLDSTELDGINALISAGGVKTTAGDPLTSAWAAGLIRLDKQRAYPIQDGLPILLIESGIELKN
jgi:uncharacterized protein YbaR (Trm112 family)